MKPLPTDAQLQEEVQEIRIDPWTTNGVAAAGASGFTIACLVRWFIVGSTLVVSLKRLVVAVVVLGAVAWGLRTYLRRQQAKFTHESILDATQIFLQRSAEFDSLASSALSFIFEVELIARGYRL